MTDDAAGLVQDARPAPSFLERHYPICLIAVWLACSAAAILVKWRAIRDFVFPDPDDVMRLMEVRDWLAGQSWFDVTQYRLNPPWGYSMHWSRLVDLPLAAVIALLQPWFGQRVAETAAAVIVPMVTLGIVMALVAALTRRRYGAGPALLAAIFCLINVGNIYATQPMRIDHHGWEAVAGLAMVLALTSRRTVANAALAGLFAGLWTHISLEGIAFTAGAAAWLGLRWIIRPEEEGYRLPAFLGALTATGTVLILAVHGTALIGRTFCDAVSPVHIALFGTAALLTALACRLAPPILLGRGAFLAIAGAACVALYKLWAPQCLAGPFNMLSPLGYQLWYLKVHEGRPVWELGGTTGLLWISFPFIGLAGAVLAWRKARDGTARAALLDYVALLAIATAIGILVLRANAFANFLAIPGDMALILLAFDRSQNWPSLPRVLGRVAAILLLGPLGMGMLVAGFQFEQRNKEAARPVGRCSQINTLAKLDALPPTTFMGAINMSPMLVAATHHHAVAAGYHRNVEAMDDLLRFFTGDDRTARAIARRRTARYVIFCADGSDIGIMAKFAPTGLAARLRDGHPPAWLRPVPLPDMGTARIYAVR